MTKLLLRMIGWLMVFHLAEISVWALFYLWRSCMPNAEAAFYFSGVTYTTIGYGDLVLAKPWRLLSARHWKVSSGSSCAAYPRAISLSSSTSSIYDSQKEFPPLPLANGNNRRRKRVKALPPPPPPPPPPKRLSAENYLEEGTVRCSGD